MFNHLTLCINKMSLQIIYFIYKYKQSLVLKKQECFIGHKNQIKQNQSKVNGYIISPS